jgi:pimeloyl-ACP methyl ester carboxylesterase
VDQFVEEALAFPHQQSVEAFQAQVEVCLTHDTVDRLSGIAAPTLVVSGELDVSCRRVSVDLSPQKSPTRASTSWPGEAHQPFQELPDEFNAPVDAFWREAEARG